MKRQKRKIKNTTTASNRIYEYEEWNDVIVIIEKDEDKDNYNYTKIVTYILSLEWKLI